MATVLSIAIFPTWFVTVGAMIAIQTLADTGGLLKRSREFNVNKTLLSGDLPGGGGGVDSKRAPSSSLACLMVLTESRDGP